MAVEVKVGRILQKTTTGNQATTGVGFQPKLVLFWMNSQSASGIASHAEEAFGAAVSSSSRFYNASTCRDSEDDTGCRHDNTKCIGVLQKRTSSGSTVVCAADLVSMDADGFTLNWTTTDGTARYVEYMALGGDALTNVAITQWTSPTSTGSQDITTVGFQPDTLLFSSVWQGSAPPVSVAGAGRVCGAVDVGGQEEVCNTVSENVVA